ncbi:hypothetical protein [Klenkia taihuensis]|uniref:hypothetical protein n=1 Tax=Klenkia taihuensis TaxID=1225127 RepID=UPI001041CF7E|nr:hypothetical protein [Klenkia taihuensis]
MRLPTLLQSGVLALAMTLAGVLLAAPALAEPTGTPTPSTTASAVVDPARPTARLLHGPNCSDGFVRVEVTNGSAEHTVALTYDGVDTGTPATLAVGERTVLEGAELDWGTRAEVGVAVTGVDGPEEPLDLGDWTRPTEEDCDAVAGPTGTTSPTTAPTSTAPPSTAGPTTSSGPSGAPTTRPTPTTTATPRPPTGTPSTSPRPTSEVPATPTSSGGSTSPSGAGAAPTVGGSSSTGQVSPGSVLTIRGTGFAPGEAVTVTLAGSTAPLATVTADDQGRVEAVVQIPQDVVLGPAVVRLVGVDSSSATEVALEVAARDTPGATGRTPWPLMAAGLLLLALATTLATIAARRPRRDDWQPPAGAEG